MDEIAYSITVAEDVSEHQYQQIVEGFSRYFAEKDLKVKEIRKKGGSTIIEFILETAQKPEVIITMGGIAVFILKTFAGEIIKKAAEKIMQRQVHETNEEKKEDKPFYEVAQYLAAQPSHIVAEYISSEVIRRTFKVPDQIVTETRSIMRGIRIQDLPNQEIEIEVTLDQESNEFRFRIDYKGPLSEQ